MPRIRQVAELTVMKNQSSSVVLPASNRQCIRRHKSHRTSMTKWQKNLGAKKWIRENCAPLFRTAIFLPFYIFAFLLVAAAGRAGYSPDGTLLAVGRDAGDVSVWDVNVGRVLWSGHVKGPSRGPGPFTAATGFVLAVLVLLTLRHVAAVRNLAGTAGGPYPWPRLPFFSKTPPIVFCPAAIMSEKSIRDGGVLKQGVIGDDAATSNPSCDAAGRTAPSSIRRCFPASACRRVFCRALRA